jgi:hypothetical protein
MSFKESHKSGEKDLSRRSSLRFFLESMFLSKEEGKEPFSWPFRLQRCCNIKSIPKDPGITLERVSEDEEKKKNLGIYQLYKETFAL